MGAFRLLAPSRLLLLFSVLLLLVVHSHWGFLRLMVQLESGGTTCFSSYRLRQSLDQSNTRTLGSTAGQTAGDEIWPRMPHFGNVAPLVSIIISAHNNVNKTLQALRSISHLGEAHPFEVIVYDDFSTDATPEMLAQIEGIVTARSKQAVGFAGANNFAAFNLSSPTSRYMWFLNNDVEVENSTLAALLGTLEARLDAGAVGCKLVYPNGILQEAGSMVFQQGSCAGYGRGGSPAAPEYNYVRSVDYCSACCLLVRREVFALAGGFEAHTFPHYYEDSDLQLKIKYEQGLAVLYQPLARVTHHEYSSKTQEEAQRLMTASEVIFHHKWKPFIDSRHFPPDPANMLCGRENTGTKRILFVDQLLGDPDTGSGYGRALLILHALAQFRAMVTMYPMLDRRPPRTLQQLLQRGVEVIWNDTAAWEYSDNLLAGRRQELCQFLEARAGLYDAVIVSRPPIFSNAHECIRKFQPQAYLVFDSEALWYTRDEARARALHDQALLEDVQRSRVDELKLFALADESLLVTQSDRERVAEFYGGKQVQTKILSFYVEPLISQRTFDQRADLLFIGAFHDTMYYNGDAVKHFVTNVFPLVRQQNDKAKIVIIGKEPPAELLALDDRESGVHVLGSVDDLNPYYDNALLFVAPHQYGAGIQIKVLDSMAHGVPVVAMENIVTQLGAKNVTSGILGARDSECMAAQITNISQDKGGWEALREASIEFVQEHYSRSSFLSSVDNLLARIPQTACRLGSESLT